MQRPSILILPFHGIGHFNALFGVARALARTHNVVFAGTGYFLKHVALRGFPYVTLKSHPFGVGLEAWIHETRKSKYPKVRAIVDRWKDTVYHERKAELTQLLIDLKPVHILIDSQQATDLIVIKTIDQTLRVSLLTVSPPYLLIPGLPAINSLAMPGDRDDQVQDALDVLREKKRRYRWRFLGMDDWTMVNRRLRKNKMTDLKDAYPSLITFAAKGVDHYVLTYKEYDFHHPHLDSFRYVGHHADVEHAEEWPARLNQLKASGKKLVYCAFGTVPSKKDIDGFMVKLKRVVIELDLELVVGTTAQPVPQLAVLSCADVFITHGGINSVHDAIRQKTPMIVYPVDDNYDQRGNSSRVVHHGFGLRGDIEMDTADDIRSKLIEIFTDIRFKKNLEAFNPPGYDLDRLVKMIL